MVHSGYLRFNVFFVVFGGFFNYKGYRTCNIYTDCAEPFNLSRIIGNQLNRMNTHVVQNPRNDTVLPTIVGETQMDIGIDGIKPLVLQRVRRHLVGQSDPPSFLLHVDHASSIFLDEFQGHFQLLFAVASLTTKDLTGKALIMNPHGNILPHNVRIPFHTPRIPPIQITGRQIGAINDARLVPHEFRQSRVQHGLDVRRVGHAVGTQPKMSHVGGEVGFGDEIGGDESVRW
mmetsp:Transcript_24484/g.30074  ORF Transcript_24484/g.30074 Transcript_24484/m.30074 type:complete len:231 (+) Transcript_24484:725-1417(+)